MLQHEGKVDTKQVSGLYNVIKVIKGELPCQAVMNNMYVDETPTQLASLAKLEQVLTD